jgi:hypothetical protein
MSVPKEAVKPGAVFQFPRNQRRVVDIFHRTRGWRTGDFVRWEYADGEKRNGKSGGVQDLHYFCGDAKPLVDGKVAPTYASLESELERLKAKEQEVCKYIVDLTGGQIGCGEDPIGFLIASHAAISALLDGFRAAGIDRYKKALEFYADESKWELVDEASVFGAQGYLTAQKALKGE